MMLKIENYNLGRDYQEIIYPRYVTKPDLAANR
jgi:hypothetical protein